MAIPFYEDKPVVAAAASSQLTDGDQVDGPASYHSNGSFDQVDYEAPGGGAATSNTQAASMENQNENENENETQQPTTEEQLLAWKTLALAMCKVLKQFYLQQTGKSTKLTATVQIQPQTQ